MKGSTHLAAGATIGLFISMQSSLNPISTIALTTGTLFGSILPDIDNATSKLGRKISPASWLIQLFLGHRTVFHSPLLYLLLISMITTTKPDSFLIILGMAAGVVSHLLLDMLNPAGIPLFWPLSKRYRILRLHSGGLIDRILSVLLTGVSIYLFVHYFL